MQERIRPSLAKARKLIVLPRYGVYLLFTCQYALVRGTTVLQVLRRQRHPASRQG